MKLSIAIAALLASVAVSAGELDGKALICKKTDRRTMYIEFKDGNVIGTEIRPEGSKAVAYKFGGQKTYVTSPTEVSFWNYWILDRATLVLEFQRGLPHQCEVATSLDSFRATIEAERLEKQKAIDEEMKDNKI